MYPRILNEFLFYKFINKFIMKVTFLGTGTSQGVPVIGCNDEVCLSENKRDKRLRSSVLIEWNKYCYVIDCGPDFREQMLAANVTDIDGILFTHEHADHTAGLDDVRSFSHRNGGVPIFSYKRVIENLEQRFYYIFKKNNRYPGAPRVEVNEISNNPFVLGNLKVVPINILHGQLNIFAYRFNDFAYITDAKNIEDEEKDKLKNLDVLVINALRIDSHPTHFNLEEALDFIAEVKPKRAYLTHISHKLGFHEQVSKMLPENVFLAYDQLVIDVKPIF